MIKCDICRDKEVEPKLDDSGKITNPPICDDCLKGNDYEDLKNRLKELVWEGAQIDKEKTS